MNPNPPQPSRDDIEVRLTALLLGELPPAEAELLRWSISQDAELAKIHDRLKGTLGLVREVVAISEHSAVNTDKPIKMSEERRQKLLAHFKTVSLREPTPVPFQTKVHRRNRWLVPLAAMLVIGGIEGVLLMPTSRTAGRARVTFAKAENTTDVYQQDKLTVDRPAAHGKRPLGSATPETLVADNQPALPLASSSGNTVPLKIEPANPVANGGSRGGNGGRSEGNLQFAGNLNASVSQASVEANSVQSGDSPVHTFGSVRSSLNGFYDGGKTPANEKNSVAVVSGIMPANGPPIDGVINQSKPDRRLREGQEERSSFSYGQTAQRYPSFSATNMVAISLPETDPATGLPPLAGVNRMPGSAPSAMPAPSAASGQYSFNLLEKDVPAQLVDSENQIRAAQSNVNQLGESLHVIDNDPASLAPSPTMSADTLQNYNSQMIEGTRDYGSLVAQLGALKSMDQEKLREVLPKITGDANLSSLLARLDAARQHYVSLSISMSKDDGTQDLNATTMRAIINELEKQVDARVAGIMTGLETEVATKTANLDARASAKKLANDQDKVAQETLDKAVQTPPMDVPVPQPEVATKDNAFSTFSLNVSDVSFKLAAASLEHNVLPQPGSIRSEEFVNAFDYRDPEPAAGAPVGFAWERAGDAFAHNRDFLRFSIKTAAEGRAPGRPLNLVLLLDKSGSMERADRVAIIREALRVLAAQLGPNDTLSVITFARTARLYVDGARGNQAREVFDKLGGITPQGGTNLEEAMNLAYQTALRHYLQGGVNRVVLMTDGAANLGSVDPQQFKQKVETNRKQGIAIDCFGIGWEDYNDNLLEMMASHGDGRYGFLNTPAEASSGFAAQLAGALKVAAADVKVQVEFNPARVKAYRQIGYATHQLTKQQFRDNTVDAAVIGAAEAGNGLYTVQIDPQGEGPVATVRVRFRAPGTSDVQEHSWIVPYTGTAVALDQASPAMRLAAVAGTFAEYLMSSPYAAGVTPDELARYLSGVPEVYGTDPRPRQLESMLRESKGAAVK